MTYKPCDSWEDDTSTKWRGDKLLRAVGKLQQDEKVHRAYLVSGMSLRTKMRMVWFHCDGGDDVEDDDDLCDLMICPKEPEALVTTMLLSNLLQLQSFV